VASEDTLTLVLETLGVILEVDEGKWLTPDLAASLVEASLDVWSKNNKGGFTLLRRCYYLISYLPDPIFVSVLIDILTNLASSKNDGIYKIVVEQALPPLCLCIGSAKKEESWITASAIDLVGSLVSGAPESGLGEGFFETLAPNLFSCLSIAEDRDVLQVRPFL
jgi:hypothetical protein